MFTPADIKALQDKKKAEGQAEITPIQPSPMKPFKRKPHLTDRPLKDNAGLLALRDSLEPKKRRSGGH